MNTFYEHHEAAGDGEFTSALGITQDRDAYRAAMIKTGEMMIARSATRHVPAVRIARMFAHAGDTEGTMQWLERAYENREAQLARVTVFWDWDDLRSDPRFQTLLARMNFPR